MKRGQADQKSGIPDTINDSNPPLSASKTGLTGQKRAFFYVSEKLCQDLVPDFDRDTVPNYLQARQPRYPFKAAKLVHHGHDMTRRWYVDYHAWDLVTERLKRVRQFEPLNREKNLYKRLQLADNLIRVINGALRMGKCLGKDKLLPATVQARKFTFISAIDFYLEQKKLDRARDNYLHNFRRLKANYQRYLETENISDRPLKELSTDDLVALFNYFQVERKVSNKTFNNYRNDVSVFLSWILRRFPGILKSNPIVPIRSLKVVSRKHAAFSDDQMKMVKAACEKRIASGDDRFAQLLLFINFIYYSLVRPGELRNLKIAHLDFAGNRIFIPGEISKNRSDEYVAIAPALKKAIKILKSFDKDDFIFGRGSAPGPARPASSCFWRLNSKILKDLELATSPSGGSYDLYSYKHSGAINLYKATKDIKLVQRQCRHKTLEQTNIYLRDLDLLSDHDALRDWRGAL